jgi:hypothetical protein
MVVAMAKISSVVAVATLFLVHCDAFLVPQSYIGKPYKAQADKCTMTSFSPGSAFLPTRASHRLRAVGSSRRAASGLCQLKSQMKPGTEAEKTKQIDLDFEGLQKQFAIFWKMATPYVRFPFLCPMPLFEWQSCGKTFNRPVLCRTIFCTVPILTIIPSTQFKEDRTARVLIAVVVGFTLLNSFVSVQFSYLGRDFWTALR